MNALTDNSDRFPEPISVSSPTMTPRIAIVQSNTRTTDARLALLRELHTELNTELQHAEHDFDAIAVHDVRVAARKLRVVLRALRDEANPALYAQLKFDLTNLSREFAQVRNADVQLQLAATLLQNNLRVNEKDRRSLVVLLERRVTSARRALARHTQSARWQQCRSRIAKLIGDDELLLLPVRPANKELTEMLIASIDRALATDKRSNSVPALHKTRIRIKSTRYMCEALAAPLKLDARKTIGVLCKAQETLGELHDRCVLIDCMKSAPIPAPLLKQLVQAADNDVQAYRKHYRRMRPELCKRLHKLAKTLSTQ
jgi:CHAD domain-containing protein